MYTDPTQAPPEPVLDQYMQLPTAQYGLVQGTTVSDSGGGFSQDVTFADIAWGVFPFQILLKGGEYLDNITMDYAYQAPYHQPFTKPRGGDGGGQPMVISLGDAGDKITALSTMSGDLVNQITITTTMDPVPIVYPPDP